MDNNVIYNVTAKDGVSAVLQQMHGKATQLTSAMGGVTKILGTLGVGFGIFKGLEFIRGGIEKVEKLHQSLAQVEAGLESTGGAAGMTMEGIKSMADEMSSRMKFGKADIIDMQAQMLTFGGITKENFPAIGDAIANVASKIGMDLHGMSIQFGKAMDNPSEGIRKLSRQGVLFSKEQAAQIDLLVSKGKTVEAQQIMLTEIQNKYGGASKAAFDADPLAKFSKMMGSFQVAVGEAAIGLLEFLMPALELIAQTFKNVGNGIRECIAFVKENKDVFESLAIAVGIVGGAYLLYQGYLMVTTFYQGLVAATAMANAFANTTLSMSTVILNGAMATLNATFLANPAFWVVIGIVAVIATFVLLWKKCDEFRAFFIGMWEALKTSLNLAVQYMLLPIKVLIGAIEGIWKALHGDFDGMKDSFKSGFNDFLEAGKDTANAFKKGYDGEMTKSGIHNKLMKDSEAQITQINNLVAKNKISDDAYRNAVANMKTKLSLGVKKGTISEDESGDIMKKLKSKSFSPLSTKPTGTGAGSGSDKSSSVSGSKVVTINVTIGSLINDFQIKTTNLQESTTAIREKVVQALTGAINQSQITAGA